MKSYSELTPDVVKLIDAAAAATGQSYSPYSQFKVGTALALSNGSIVTGSNIENAAFPQCTCAERVALSQKEMLFPNMQIIMMVITARKGDSPALTPVSPCGGCRQMMLEFEARQNRLIKIVIQISADQWLQLDSAASLLPYGFTIQNLIS